MILEKYNIHFHRFSESTFEMESQSSFVDRFKYFLFFSISQMILPKARSIDNGHRSNPLLDQTHQPLSTNIRPCFSAITSNFSILNKPILRSPVPHTFTLNFDRPHRGNPSLPTSLNRFFRLDRFVEARVSSKRTNPRETTLSNFVFEVK